MADELGFWAFAEAYPDKTCIIDPDGTEHTFGEVLARSNRYSHGLRALGLEPGDHVAVLLPNESTLLEVYLACLQMGLYFTPVNWHLVASEIAYILTDSEAKVFVASDRFAEAATAAADEVGIAAHSRFASGTIAGLADISLLGEGHPDTRPDDLRSGQPMLYTSGTTGNPKGVRRPMTEDTPDDSAVRLSFYLLLYDIQPHDGVHLACGPLYHAAVLIFSSASLFLGHTVVLMDKWTPEDTLERIERYKVTSSHMVPTMFHRLLALPDDVRAKADVSSLRNMVHAAAPCPVPTKRAMLDWWGPCIYEYYAATEGGGTLVKPDEWLAKPGTVGQPWPTAEIRIADDDGNLVDAKTEGTVWIKPPAGAEFEYHKAKEKTAESWKEGFFTVGDVGYLDDDGWLYLCDRKADMIISGGVNIYPAEIENVLATHPKVADVAVIGVPNDEFGEEVKAIVEPISDGAVDAAELIAYCEDKLAGYKRPRSFEFRDTLPRTDTGKLLKRELRAPYWEGRDRAI